MRRVERRNQRRGKRKYVQRLKGRGSKLFCIAFEQNGRNDAGHVVKGQGRTLQKGHVRSFDSLWQETGEF